VRIIEREMEIGNASELKALENFVTDEAGCVFESLDGASLLCFGTASADEDSRVAAIGRNADLVDNDGDFKAWVFKFAGEHGVDFVGDFFADSLVTMVSGCHGTSRMFFTASRKESQAASEEIPKSRRPSRRIVPHGLKAGC
jgi:hypothetical protein